MFLPEVGSLYAMALVRGGGYRGSKTLIKSALSEVEFLCRDVSIVLSLFPKD